MVSGTSFTHHDLAASHLEAAVVFADIDTSVQNLPLLAGDFLLRNPVVALDHLGSGTVASLSPTTRHMIDRVSAMAVTMLPDYDSSPRRPQETARDFSFRRLTLDPLHHIGSQLGRFSMIPALHFETQRLILRSSELFGGILEDTVDTPAITRSYEYFDGNTRAAIYNLEAN